MGLGLGLGLRLVQGSRPPASRAPWPLRPRGHTLLAAAAIVVALLLLLAAAAERLSGGSVAKGWFTLR